VTRNRGFWGWDGGGGGVLWSGGGDVESNVISLGADSANFLRCRELLKL
jgi:hypothetical protein